jgi:hypothetical protein
MLVYRSIGMVSGQRVEANVAVMRKHLGLRDAYVQAQLEMIQDKRAHRCVE